MVELISPPTFEVGKKYINRSAVNLVIFTVECILEKTNEVVFTYFSTHQEKIVSSVVQLSSFDTFKEYLPPPPEEWRALFYVKNGKPEVSASYGTSKSEVEEAWKDSEPFMYAIRTDINAKKENSNGK